jgi:hypothetical protein
MRTAHVPFLHARMPHRTPRIEARTIARIVFVYPYSVALGRMKSGSTNSVNARP